MNRGEIWLGVYPNDPQKKPRPLLIVSNNFRNQQPRLKDIVIVKLTSLQNSKGLNKPTSRVEDVIINLKKQTIVRCASVFTIEKSSLKSKITQLQVTDMDKVDSCLKTVLDIN